MSTALSEQLLDAHVAHLLDELGTDTIETSVSAAVDALFSAAGQQPLASFVSIETLQAVARRHVSDSRYGESFRQRVVQIASVIDVHPVHAETRLGDVVSDEAFESWLDQLLSQRQLRERLIARSVGNPVYSELVADLLVNGIKGYLASANITGRIPGARSALKIGRKLADRARPGIEDQLDEGLRSYVQKNTQASLKASERFLNARFDEDRIRAQAMKRWQQVRDRSLAELRLSRDDIDIEEIAGTGFDGWNRFRRVAYFQALLDVGIEAFFDIYGQRPLVELFDDIGLQRDDLVADALAIAPQLITALRESGVLETLLRDNLARFYRSEAVTALLSGED